MAVADVRERTALPRWIPTSIVSWTIIYSILSALLIAGAATWATYATSRRFIEDSALRTVGVTATARKTDLTRALARQRDRVQNILRLAVESCVATGAADQGCITKITSDFVLAERALWAELLVDGRTINVGPQPPRDVRLPDSLELARFARDAQDRPYYLMAIVEGGTRIIVAFPVGQIVSIFAERSGLGSSGETFLADAAGRFLTPPRHAVLEGKGVSHPIDALPMQTCLSRRDGELIAADYRGVEVIHGFRFVPEIGGGCIMAHMSREEALAPAARLRRDVVGVSILILIPMLIIGVVAARLLTRPLQRLTRSAEAVRAGNYDAHVPVRGPREIRLLGATLAALTTSVRESVTRERELRMEAEEANRAKDQFLATVSHELRTPMTSVIGWARMLELQSDDPETLRAGIEAIQRSSKAQAELIEDLLDASRIATGKLRLEIKPVDLREVVTGQSETFLPAATAKEITLHVDVPKNAVIVAGDETRLAQIINNLLTNALKFTDRGGRIEVKLVCTNHRATVSVTDTGIGIAPEFLPSIFDRFRQQDSSETRRHGGLGLGLAIVKQLVEMHRGTVSAESEGIGKGATLKITLPALEASRSEPVAPTAESFGSLAGKRVLVVDDETEILDLLESVFRSSGAEVERVRSAREAYELLVADGIDLLVSDLSMPREDGLSLISRLRSSGITTPAIALTALGGLDDEQRALAAGFDGYVRKPVDPLHLVAAGIDAIKRS